jgi:hypothetical protein
VAAAFPKERFWDLAGIGRAQAPAVVSHYDSQRVIDIYAASQGRDLGVIATDVGKIMDEYRGKLPRGSFKRTLLIWIVPSSRWLELWWND